MSCDPPTATPSALQVMLQRAAEATSPKERNKLVRQVERELDRQLSVKLGFLPDVGNAR